MTDYHYPDEGCDDGLPFKKYPAPLAEYGIFTTFVLAV